MRTTPAVRPPESGGCTLETLARSRALHVQRCNHCNTLSLHFGPVTLRFDAATAEALWSTLGEALVTLHARRDDEEPSASAPRRSAN